MRLPPRPRPPAEVRRRSVALRAAVVWAAACASPAAPLEDRLPGPLAIRSETPWVIGRITAREVGAGDTVRLHVVGRAGPLGVPRAVVTVGPATALYRPNGRAARPADLRARREVVVWARGPERPSTPPERTADAVLVE